MMRSTLISSLMLAVLCTSGCNTKKPKGTQHPDDPSAAAKDQAAAQGGKSGDASATEPGAATPGDAAAPAEPAEDPSKKVCDAKVSDKPTALFMETMLIRLPFGLAEEALIEQTPFLLLARPFTSVGCIEGMPGADINVTAMGYFQDNEKRPVKDIALELLTAQGYTGTPKIADEVAKGRNIEFSAEFAADEKHPNPSKVWVAMKTKFGRNYYVLFDVHPNAWNAVRKTLKESTDRMFLLKGEG